MGGVPDNIRRMLDSILDLGGWSTRWELGEHYLPEAADDVFGEDN